MLSTMVALKIQDLRIMVTVLLLAPIKCEMTTKYSSENIQKEKQFDDWLIAPFEKWERINPILEATGSEFSCPVTNKIEKWESGGVSNPTAVVKDGKVYLFYTALSQESEKYGVTPRIGLATSEDGLEFSREENNSPIFYPNSDWEMQYGGGYQDPKIVAREDGTFFMIYTRGNGSDFALKVATSTDLKDWTSRDFAFKDRIKSKSASIITRFVEDRFVAAEVNGSYWMYFWNAEEDAICIANSSDLIRWTPVEFSTQFRGGFGNSEPGPQAILRFEGILLMYNSRDANSNGNAALLGRSYTEARQALFDINDPTNPIDQSKDPFLNADKFYESNGHNREEKSIFLSALVCFQGKWLLYYGAGNNKIAVAIKEDEYCNIESYDFPGSTESIVGSGNGDTMLHNSNASTLLLIFILTLFYNGLNGI